MNVKEGETSPPSRYTSGSIILAMENAGKLIEDEKTPIEEIKETVHEVVPTYVLKKENESKNEKELLNV